jgi:hypothetical protein
MNERGIYIYKYIYIIIYVFNHIYGCLNVNSTCSGRQIPCFCQSLRCNVIKCLQRQKLRIHLSGHYWLIYIYIYTYDLYNYIWLYIYKVSSKCVLKGSRLARKDTQSPSWTKSREIQWNTDRDPHPFAIGFRELCGGLWWDCPVPKEIAAAALTMVRKSRS